MFKADYHMHTKRSFDGDMDIKELCRKAISEGLIEIAITDHCDCNEEPHLYDLEACYEDFILARELYSDDINIRFGIELGQATQSKKYAFKLLKEGKFDFVLGSLHNLNGVEDFFYMDYEKYNIDALLKDYFIEMEEMVEQIDFDVLGHLDYPAKYLINQNISFDLMDYKEQIAEILKLIIKKGKGIEVNTSGYRSKMERTLPDFDILKLYKDLGGEIITIGSDAHHLHHIGFGIEEGLELIISAGFHYLSIFEGRKAKMVKI
jgi:histidinol-phosphatase (PHP family)